MKAILVDLDGTLTDTHAANLAAYKAAIDETGVVYDRPLLERYVGRLAWKPMLANVLPDLDESRHFAIAQRKREIYAGLLDMVAVNDVLVSFLRMHQGKVPIALVTSASRGSVEPLLRAKALDDVFSLVITSDDVERQKPDPEPYARAALSLGVAAADCVVLEDSDVGAAAAKAFGAQVWRVEWINAG
ncbi:MULTISPECIES: HAD family phosphatase [Xanthomonas]|uniref:HAD-IA family hydrolase n=1 Tax=Xanthomonas sontii TaxID=2650745 RepID=A0A6N7QBI8_9XANT|nr:HAD family phosphatase [Xanthomonas sp. LMG 12462]KAB7767680.1 hypothetical protein CEK69_14435 [Xanthomonas sp. LMG 12462]MRH01684.1 HAD-IA family hydrolase [Xanthomonas sontii]MRH76016.1 HAD-IA family hydrolase [Xanthomonas sontii]